MHGALAAEASEPGYLEVFYLVSYIGQRRIKCPLFTGMAANNRPYKNDIHVLLNCALVHYVMVVVTARSLWCS